MKLKEKKTDIIKNKQKKAFYDKERDSAFIICHKCGKCIYMEGTFEYGFEFNCDCEKE